MSRRIAIIGTGPTGIHAFHDLTAPRAAGRLRLDITLFEQGPRAGIGLPYAPGSTGPQMLANIASIEIPPLLQTYLEWMRAQPAETLAAHGLRHADLHERLFTPRLLLGAYYRDQLLGLIRAARQAGHRVTLREACRVADITAEGGRLRVTAPLPATAPFDDVILATGHSFPRDEPRSLRFASPWSGLVDAEVPAARVGIMGTSLSGIDAAVTVALKHGRFDGQGDAIRYRPERPGLHLTLMSRQGLLPEADFHCPIPPEPPAIATPRALRACLSDAAPLDRVFDLIRAEITRADPAFALRIGLGGLDADSFAPALFAPRRDACPFAWARADLARAEADRAARVTVPWRYAILRLHEAVEAILPGLPPHDRARFDAGLRAVFVDNYAAVPPDSIRRLLALRRAGLLSVIALGPDYALTQGAGRTRIRHKGQCDDYDIFIDARGQRAMTSAQMPFPGLRATLVAAGQDVPRTGPGQRLQGVPGFGHLAVAALPYLLHQRPFVQGITACARMGAEAAAAILQDVDPAPAACLAAEGASVRAG